MTNDGVQPIKASRLPLPARAQQYLLQLIEDGVYGPGDQFPSEGDLATQLGISRATLREALLNLEQEGAIIRKHGVGTFVAPAYGGRLDSGLERLESILELAAKQGLTLELQALRVETEEADDALAEKLQVAAGSPVICICRVIVADGTPVAYMWDAVLAPLLSVSDINGAFEGSVLDLLRQKPEIAVAQATADIVALEADDDLAGKLGIETGHAILLVEEVVYDQQGAPFEFSRNYFVPEFFRFYVVRR